jgi:hypothetical protein
MPFVTDEQVCQQDYPSEQLATCVARLAAEGRAQGARISEVNKRCTALYPADVALNNECRLSCWSSSEDALNCTVKMAILLNQRREYEIAQRHHEIVVGSVVIGCVAVVTLLLVRRTRTAIGRYTARCIYAVSGFDMRRVSERWGRYR